MELRTYAAIIWRRKWIILMGSAMLILLTLLGVYMVPDKYPATARLRFFTPKSGGTSYIDFNIYYATRVMNTYSSLASSSSMAQEIKDKLNLPKPPKIKASVITDSELINITSEEKDPNLSASIANTTAEMLVDRSKIVATDAQSSAEKAIHAQLDQLNKELAVAREVYKRLNIPHNQNNYRITELTSEIQNDQQLYISLKNVYEQNVQLIRKDETALTKLNAQITDLENKITTNKAAVDQLNQLSIQDSAQIESARDEITLKEQEYSNLVTQLDQIQTLAIIQGSNQLVLEEKAIPSTKPSSPNRLLITLIGTVFSIFLSIVAGFIVDNLDDSIQNYQQIETTIDGKFIGDIYFAGNRIQKIFNQINNKQVIETNHTYLNLHRQIQKQKLKTVGLCGVVPGTSNSGLATRVSIEYANSGMKVLLLDASMLASDLYHYFPGLKAKAGLSDYLTSELMVDEIINPTGIENFSIIPPGSKTPANGLLLSSKKMLVLLKSLKADYDLVFVEISPFSNEGDVDDLICHVDGIVEVIQKGRSKMKNMVSVARHLVELNAPLVGFIFTHS